MSHGASPGFAGPVTTTPYASADPATDTLPTNPVRRPAWLTFPALGSGVLVAMSRVCPSASLPSRPARLSARE